MKQFGLVVRVKETFRSWEVSNALVAWTITMAGLATKSLNSQAWLTYVYTGIDSAQIYGAVDTCAKG